ncbi:hypothetical protein [Brochothrix thermosphacta]|uniref:hypothetical protein n=1 Tax=Brochothrix thermosphacta TaxID=2756 RepID=UPI001C4FDDD2|nr:hypothetical protein [Brochothrix thermosphacta]
MTKQELTDYLEKNLSNHTVFLSNALDYQQEKNRRRPNKKRWTEEKMERAAYKMWLDFSGNVHEKIKVEIKKDPSVSEWSEFIDKNEMLDSLNDAIVEIEFV